MVCKGCSGCLSQPRFTIVDDDTVSEAPPLWGLGFLYSLTFVVGETDSHYEPQWLG